MMDDADILAYEQEMNEMDEWEAMHQHEMEAAEEELLAMEAAERALTQPRAGPPAPTEVVAQPVQAAVPAAPMPMIDDDSLDPKSGLDSVEDSLARAQSRLDAVLERCANALGDSEMEDTERLEDYVQRKEKATAVDATTASYLYSRPPIDVDSLPVILPGGKRMFMRKRALQSESVTANSISSSIKSLVPITELMEAIERRQIEKSMDIDTEPSKPTHAIAHSAATKEKAMLWLDKYRPQRFIDLLSDERTNREVLTWIKKWDRYVFPDKKPMADIASPTGFNSRFSSGSNATWKNGGSPHGRNGKGPQHGDDNEPVDKRPFDKIILICGPPGAGKTTLANIVARHAGYNPIEINASDDRTAGVLKNKIISAMEMQSIWGSRSPNCIVLDEIDGAMNGGDGKSAIAAIQEIVSTPLHSKNGKGKRSANHHPLTRPLICICNDQYASVLRPLRKLAKIFVLGTPSSQRLVSRLKVICRHEGLKSTTGALATLCASGDYDIRYCVNALQFQSSQCGNNITPVTSGLLGQKDHTRGLFDTMEMVFYQPKSNKSTASCMQTFNEIESASFSMGNFPLLINGLEENLPKMIFNDPTLKKLGDAFEWLGIADAWDMKVRSEQMFAFTAYIPFAVLAVHNACCTSSRRRIEYPKTHFELQSKHEKSVNILQALVENSQLHQSLRVSPGVLVIDVVPWLLGTISPNIRRINPSLQTKEEKTMIQRLIQIMASLGLSFRPKYLPDGSEDYALEPAIDELVIYRGADQDSASRSMLPLTVRKMITREVELEQMRRSETSTHSNSGEKSNESTASKPPAPVTDLKSSAKAFILPELSEEQMSEKMEAIRKRNPFAFAHREAKRKRADQAKAEQQEELSSDLSTRPQVRFKFNEGYTCGIKTTVYIRDLL